MVGLASADHIKNPENNHTFAVRVEILTKLNKHSIIHIIKHIIIRILKW
jgi:hypothetical protein